MSAGSTAVEFAGEIIEVTCEMSKDVRPLITDRVVATVGSLSLLGESIVDLRPRQAARRCRTGATCRTIEAVRSAT